MDTVPAESRPSWARVELTLDERDAQRVERQEAVFAAPIDRTSRDCEKLLKALKREQKGAARELRRDAEYLARARDDERDRVSGAKQEERHKNFAWLQDQQASLNQQVRKGGAMVTGGGSSIKRSASAVLKSGRRMK